MDASLLGSKEFLLEQDISDQEKIFRHHKKHNFNGSLLVKSMLLVIICLAASNTYLLVRYQRKTAQPQSTSGRSKYAGLAYDTPVTYHNYTDYMSQNKTLSDELWDNIDTSPVAVALTDEWATEHDIAISKFRFPWDEAGKAVYYLKGYHHLHCLKVIRKAYIDFVRGNPTAIAPGHVYHCLDAMRQDVMCTADDTPMPLVDFPAFVGNGQTRMCRNFDQFTSWTKEPERHACYHRWTDYAPPTKKIEMFGFCEEGSEYYPLMSAYFEKWGHKDPYEGYEFHEWKSAEGQEE